MACYVPGCNSHASKKENERDILTFHRIPKDVAVRKEWMDAISRTDLSCKINNRKVCSKHFTTSCFYNIKASFKNRRLKLDAIPTMFLPPATSTQGISTALPSTSRIQDVTDANPMTSTQAISTALPSTSRIQDVTDVNPMTSTQGISTALPSKNSIQAFTDTNPESPRRHSCSAVLQSSNVSEKEILKKRVQVLEKKIDTISKIAKRRLRKINMFKQRERRLQKKTSNLHTLLHSLLDKNTINEEQLLTLQNLKGYSLLDRLIKKKQSDVLSKEYPLELKKFAVTLHFLSPKAYTFVRDYFENTLPHPKTISFWYKAINCDPGFTSESFDTIRLRVESQNKTLYCALIIDEMAIRKIVEWDGRKYYGYVNTGCDLESDSAPPAKEALTFMVTCINDTWKIPVGYFLINSITADQKASLVQQCISLLKETGIVVVSLTYDGATSNIAMQRHLNCKDYYFQHDGFDISLWPDPCHNMKLVRNTFGDKREMVDCQGNKISWHYIELLHQIQNAEGLHLGTKLKREHINYIKQKMKVRLATQLLSNSVADALLFCKDLGLSEFSECEGTVTFIRTFNNLFDILNSRNMRAKGFKKATAVFNFPETEVFFEFAESYIKNLKFTDGVNVVNSNRKTGFLGFITCMNSLKRIYLTYVVDRSSPLHYLCTYKLNQDHIELFFGAIRSLCGFNNNPSARMYQSAYKKLLVHAQFKDGAQGNCLPLENITVLNYSPKRNVTDRINQSSDRQGLTVDEGVTFFHIDHDYVHEPNSLSEYATHVVKYIAGFVSRTLRKRMSCETCIDSLEKSKEENKFSLITVKDRGGLVTPSDDVYRVCVLTEKILREKQLQIGCNMIGTPKNIQIIILKVSKALLPSSIFLNLFDHCLEQCIQYGDDHRNCLIKTIAHAYLKIRIHHITKNIEEPDEKIRTFLTKTILFKGQ